MRTKFYIINRNDVQRVSKKEAQDIIGKEKLKGLINEAFEAFREDPWEAFEIMISSGDRLGIEFDY